MSDTDIERWRRGEKYFPFPQDLPDWLRAVPPRRALVRLEDTPVFSIFWYYYLHQEMYCPPWIVYRRYFVISELPVRIRNMKVDIEQWRGVYGSACR
jgi:hypothetical protein